MTTRLTPGDRAPDFALRDTADQTVRLDATQSAAGRPVARPATSPAGCSLRWRVELFWWAGCPSSEAAAELLRVTLARLGRDDVRVVEGEIRTNAEAERLGFGGSPTFAVGRHDLFPAAAAASLTCRIYQQAGGRVGPLPHTDDLADRLRAALARPWDLPGWTDRRRGGQR